MSDISAQFPDQPPAVMDGDHPVTIFVPGGYGEMAEAIAGSLFVDPECQKVLLEACMASAGKSLTEDVEVVAQGAWCDPEKYRQTVVDNCERIGRLGKAFDEVDLRLKEQREIFRGNGEAG